MTAAVLERPRLRGASHHVGFLIALVAGPILVATTGWRWPVAVYAASLALMLGVSAGYHRGPWTPAVRRWWQRADHAAIFVFIAGTYTPLGAMAMPASEGRPLLAVVWTGAALGVARAMLWPQAPRWIVSGMYVAVGWSMAIAMPTVLHTTGAPLLAVILTGGALYTLGAVIYALRWPDPWPRTFGYHEVFHALTVIAAALHYGAVIRLAALA